MSQSSGSRSNGARNTEALTNRTGRRALILVFLCACAAPDNTAIIAELESDAVEKPRPALRARTLDPAPYRPIGTLRSAIMPMLAGKVPIVLARINGVEMPCILDTGTTHIVMSGAAARACRLHIPRAPAIQLLTPGYTARFRMGAPETVEFAGNTFSGGVALVSERGSDLAQRLGVKGEVHATIGTAVLSNFLVTFDFKTREIELVPSAAAPFAGVMWTDVEINGIKKLMLIDSGATGLFLEPAFAFQLGLITKRKRDRLNTKGESFLQARFGAVKLNRVAFGPRVFTNVAAHVVKVADDDSRGGLLGIAGLGKHRWTLDYAQRRLLLSE